MLCSSKHMKHKILHQRAAIPQARAPGSGPATHFHAGVKAHLDQVTGKDASVNCVHTHTHTPALTCDALRAGEWECEG